MRTGGLLFILLPLLAKAQETKREFRIAWLAPKKEYNKFSAATSVNALKLALFTISKRHLIAHPVRVKWYDSDCSSVAARASALDARENFDPDLILGPPCSAGMRSVADLAASSHWNIPVFGWVSNDYDLRDKETYSTLIRLLPPLNEYITIIHHVSVLFNWNSYAMIHDKDAMYKSISDPLTQNSRSAYNITSTHVVDLNMDEDKIEEIFLQIKKNARIIVFAVPWMSMRRYMLTAHRLGLTAGEFAFICLDAYVFSHETLDADVLSDRAWRRNDKFDDKARIAFESVIYVIQAGPEVFSHKKFTKLVQKMEAVTIPLWNIPQGSDQIDAYAPFLYDAVVLWAILVNRSLTEGGNPRNGSYIFSQAQGIQTSGVTGNLVLDNKSDRLANIWILDMQEDGTFKSPFKVYNTNDGSEIYAPKEKINVHWPNGKVGIQNAPRDVPVCGFQGEKCPKDSTGGASSSSSLSAGNIILTIRMVLYIQEVFNTLLMHSN